MGQNDRNPTTSEDRATRRKPASGHLDPRLWALLPLVALLILGAYYLGKYLNRPEPIAETPVVQAPAPIPSPKGKLNVTEVPRPLTVTPITPAPTVTPTVPPAKPAPAPTFKQEEPAVVLPPPDNTSESPEVVLNGHTPDGSAPGNTDNDTASENDRDPVKLNEPALEYPPTAYRERVEGTVTVSYVINAEGTVENAQVSQSSGDSRLDQAAVDYVNRFRYRPATRKGQPTAVRVSKDVNFAR